MMRRFTVTLLAATAMGVIAWQGASAADLGRPVLKAPPPLPPPVQDWSGIYVGVEGGYGWGRQKGNFVDPFSLRPNVGQFFNNATCDFEGLGPHDCNTSTGQISTGAISEEFAEFDSLLDKVAKHASLNLGSLDSSGWLFGAFFGVQKQWGNWVLGLEADVDGADIKGSTSSTVHVDTNNLDISTPENTRLLLNKTASLESKIDEIASVRGKIGYAWSPNWMIYGTGGAAFAHVKNSLTDSQSLEWDHGSCDGGNFNECMFFAAASTFSASADQSMLGWTLGAGIDWKWQIDPGSAWVFGIEYQYFNFPTQTFTFSGPSGGSLAFNSSETINVVKGRISYLFSIH
jgi:outer membrane immunogenic protein